MKKLVPYLLQFLFWLGLACLSQTVSPVSPQYYNPGDTPSAGQYNTTVGGIYTWMNSYPVARLNAVTTKGDIYAHNGSVVSRLPVSTNNYVLKADATQTFGMSYASYSGATAVTTKGDVTGCDGSAVTRVPVGANGYALQCDSTAASGLSYVDLSTRGELPKGAVIAWSPAGAGTTTIPSGFLVADGTMGTPNLIGLFVIGTRPPGSGSSPASGGYGAPTADGAGSGTATHDHGASAYTTVSGFSVPNATVATDTGGGTAAHPSHVHGDTAAYATIAATSNAPAYYTCIYLVKQ